MILILIGFVPEIYGQNWKLVSSVTHPDLDKVVSDQLGNIYVTNHAGVLTKYAPDGKRLLEYAPMRVAAVHQIAAGTQLKVMLFYQNLQEILVLDRYLSFPVSYQLADFKLGFAEHMTPSSPVNIWFLDVSDFSIKLIDLRDNRLIERKSLAKVLNQESADILSFHAHQNRLYIVDKATGIQVFDNIGNFLYKLTAKGMATVGFDKDYLYFEEQGQLKFIHLYDDLSHEVLLPVQKSKKIIFVNGHLVVVTERGFNIYQYLSAD